MVKIKELEVVKMINQDILNKLKELNLKDIKVEVVGNWLWLYGNTYSIKDRLKEIGFLYSGSKKAWFYNGSKHKVNISFYKSLEDIKNKFGYKEIELKK